MRNCNIAVIKIELRDGTKHIITKKIPAFWSGWKIDSWYDKFCEDFAKEHYTGVYNADLYLRTKSGHLAKHSNLHFTEWF